MKLAYEIIYSRRRTIGITVERDRRVIVRAPLRARPEALSAAVASKRFWIWEKLRDPRKYGATPPLKEFVAGEAFLFLGQNYLLELIDEPRGEVVFNGHNFELAKADRKLGRALFRSWFLRQAKTYIPLRAATLAKAMGVQFTRISVRDLKCRWALSRPPERSPSTGGLCKRP